MILRLILTRGVIFSIIFTVSASIGAQAYTLSGTVRNPNSLPVDSVQVLMYTEQGDPVGQLLDSTDASGFYSISSIPGGTWGVSFKPPDSYDLAPKFISGLVVHSDVALDVTLEFGNILSGYVRDTLGVGIPDVDLDVYDQFTGDQLYTPNDNTDETGFYDVVIPSGTFRIRYQSKGEDDRWVPIELENVVITADANIDVVFAEGYFVSGTVTGPGGGSVVGADLDAEDSETGQKIFTPGDNTDENGEYQLLVPAGTYDINVAPNPEEHLVPEIVYGVLVLQDITLNFILDSGFVLSGTVTDPVGSGVFDVDLDVEDSYTGEIVFTTGDNTDSSGLYRITLPPGIFDVMYKPPVGVPYLASVLLQGINLVSDRVIDVTVPYGVLLSGTVQNASGAGVLGVDIDAKDTSTGISVPLVGDYTDSSGAFATVIVPGVYDLEIEPPLQRRLEAQEIIDYTISEDSEILVSLDTGLVISGTVRDSTGEPIPGIRAVAIESISQLEAFTPGNHTDSLGHYLILVHPDEYDLIYTAASYSDSVILENVQIARDTTIDVICTRPPAGSGDTNGDGNTDIVDVVYLINYLFNAGPAPVPLASGDVNGDCQIGLVDVVYFINYLFKSGPGLKPGCA